MNLDGRGAIVTGGGSGLGRATAAALVQRGARVALLDRDLERAEAAAEKLGPAAIAVQADVADEASMDAALSAVDRHLDAVHVCVNAAGVATAGAVLTKGAALPLEAFRSTIEVNLIGAFDVLRRCVERMARNEPDDDGERGVVINVSSGAAWQGQRGQAAYAASKAGLLGLTLPIARDVAELGIRVLAVAPGLFETAMAADLPDRVRDRVTSMILNPRRLGEPEEFAELVCHIVSNPYLNATTISIDAGARLT